MWIKYPIFSIGQVDQEWLLYNNCTKFPFSSYLTSFLRKTFLSKIVKLQNADTLFPNNRRKSSVLLNNTEDFFFMMAKKRLLGRLCERGRTIFT